MRQELIGWIKGQLGLEEVGLDVFQQEDEHILEGVLRAKDGRWYPILGGVPCFLEGALRPSLAEFTRRHGLPDHDQPREDQSGLQKTTATFSDKWRRFCNYGIEPSHQSFLFTWYCKKLGVGGLDELKAFYRDRRCVLEVGPGSGFNTRFMAENTTGTVIAADISEAARTSYENTHHLPNCHVIQADVMDLPLQDGCIDFIIADGVLHHTPETRAAVAALYRKLAPGGQFFFYVYRKMGPARQFCDKHIRQAFQGLSPEAGYAACEGLTELGRALSRLEGQVTLTRPIPILGIPAGTHDVQRLIYYNFVKCFWNEAFDFETNNMVNFDWYHPYFAWQHTPDEVAGWLHELGVTEYQFHDANPNGISVLLRKSAAGSSEEVKGQAA